MKVRLVILLVLGMLLLFQVTVLADNGDIPTFDIWLKAASGPLVPGIVGILLSIVVEYWPAYDKWHPKWKRLTFFGFCLVTPVVAAVLRGALGYVPWSFDPLIWHAIWNGFAAMGVGTVAHTPRLKWEGEA